MRRLITILFFVFNIYGLFAQKQANIWYFGDKCGLDFNSGEPVSINVFQQWSIRGTASISDSSGTLLFYSDGDDLYNKEYRKMLNGENLKGYKDATQRILFVQKPGSDNLYYVFNVGDGLLSVSGLWYNIIDMNGDGGLGEVILRDQFLNTAYDAQDKLFSLKHRNNKDVWIITRKYQDEFNQFAAYLLTESGLNPPVFSSSFYGFPTGHNQPREGFMKVSYDKKYIFTAQFEYYPDNILEIAKFNDSTGGINYLYFMMMESENGVIIPIGIEFSPDSKYAYVSFRDNHPDISITYIYQFEMQFVENFVQFKQSGIRVYEGAGTALQLATDGKIYCSREYNETINHYLNVIHKPWKKGLECSFQANAIDMGNGVVKLGLPNILLDHLFRFEWEGNCAGKENGVKFKPNFNPIPDSIRWVFSDPNAGIDSISTELSPTHYFTQAGDFEVIVDVWYPPTPNNPMGRYEHTSRVITIDPAPEPDLGNDIFKCQGQSIELNAGDESGAYTWSTGAWGLNLNTITVSDTATYWVRVRNNSGCFASDTIKVSLFNTPVIDNTNLILSPTTCGGSNGAIRGIEITGTQPIILEWRDNDNTIISNEPDLFNLPVGNYYLWATDGNGCTNQLAQYQIFDQGDVLIDSVDYTESYCGQNNGSITITAISGLSDMLEYSIDNGNTWHSNEGEFTGLVPDSYTVRVRVPDGSGCETMYEENPVEILSIGSMDVVSAIPADDHCGKGIGEITITGPGNDPSIYWYSNDNGATWLQNNGVFTGLSEGPYNLMIRDASGCTGAYIDNPVEIDNLPGPAITTPIIITPETGSDANGTITLTATGDDLSYSLDSGPTQDNGHFNGLSEGDYTITITDLFGCTTDTLVHVDQITGSYLLAMAGNDTLCLHKIANSNIRVTSITGVINLKATLSYDGQRLLCTHFNDSLPGITATIYETLSRIVLEWNGTTPIPSTDTISLGELIFQTKETGLADVMWDLDASNTFFTDENGNAITPVLIPGAVTVHDPPVLALSEPLPLCQGGSTRLVPGIAGGTEPISYQWQTPQGTIINTEVEIENATPDNSGIYTLMVSDYFHCADTVSTAIEVIALPSANFPASNQTHDTIYYEQTFLLEATPGFASYEWNTGDTTYYITITEQGAYSLLMETTEGCLKLESIMMINTFLPVLVPNAFTPNNDGLNDTFRPVIDYERVRMFSMVVYNHWGQLIYETTNPAEGWDGKDSPAGVYSWVISYSDMLGKGSQMKGVVTLIK